MEFLILAAIIMFFLIAATPSIPDGDGAVPNSVDDKLVITKKQCPPHQWFAQEVVDQNGKTVAWRTVCKVCGPLNGGK